MKRSGTKVRGAGKREGLSWIIMVDMLMGVIVGIVQPW